MLKVVLSAVSWARLDQWTSCFTLWWENPQANPLVLDVIAELSAMSRWLARIRGAGLVASIAFMVAAYVSL